MRKNVTRMTISLLLLVSMFMASLTSAQAAQIEPRYTGISGLSSTLRISSKGGASCEGSADARNGYTVKVTVELKQDGVPIKEWTSSGSGTVTAGGTYYVMSGHDYVVTTTAEVRNSSGKVVETPELDSLESSY